MKVTIDPKEQDSELALWRGADATVWAYHISLGRMAINLVLKGRTDSLYIVGLGCKQISGPFRWKQANIIIAVEPSDASGVVYQRIIDQRVAFELLCSGGVSVLRGPISVPKDPFEDFIGNVPNA